MASWTFLTIHARVLLLVARDPGIRLRDIAASLDVTERSAFGIITDLTEAGYVVKEKEGRRNRYRIQAHLPLPEPTARERTARERTARERTVGEVLALLTGADVAVTGQPAAAADGPDPGSSREGRQAMAGLVHDDLLPGESARVSAVERRQGRQRAECATGREEAGT